jgi:hypothetical protein
MMHLLFFQSLVVVRFGRKLWKVSHVCADERVRSKFASILHQKGDNFLNIINNHEKAQPWWAWCVEATMSRRGDSGPPFIAI